MSRASIAALMLGMAVMSGCNRASEESRNQVTPSPTEATDSPPQDVRALPAEQQRALAFTAAFGSDSPIVEIDGQSRRYAPGKLIWIGNLAVLLSPGDNLSDCHACSGALAIYYLEPAGDSFRVTGSWPALVTGWGWGKAPDWSVSDAFAEYPVVMHEGGYTGQGLTCGGVSLTELRPNAPVQSDLIKTMFADHSGLGGERDGEEINGKIVNIKKDASFEVSYSGAENFTEHWVRQGDKFVLRENKTRVPGPC